MRIEELRARGGRAEKPQGAEVGSPEELRRGPDHRFCRSGRRDGIGVPMHDIPALFFTSVERRTTQRDRCDLIAASHLRLESFKLVNAGDVTADVLRELIESDRMAVPVVRCCSRHRVADVRPSALRRAERVRQRHVSRCENSALGEARGHLSRSVKRLMRLFDDGVQMVS